MIFRRSPSPAPHTPIPTFFMPSSSAKATLTQGPIAPMLIRLTIPMVFGIFSMVAFNLVDTYFIGQEGTLELAALSFTLPVVMVLGAIGMGMSMGASAVISRAFGEGDQAKVQRLTVDSLMLALAAALLFVGLGLLTMDPLFRLLGAEGEVLELVKEYMTVWYIGVSFVIIPFVGNSAIRANGDTLTPAVIMASMVVLNIILDPILIFGWGPIPAMSLRGAAIATVIARALSLLLGLVVLYRKDMLTLRVPSTAEALTSWRSILRIGLPASATNLVVPLTTALITRLVATYGPEAVAALGVSSRIDLFAIMIVVALSSVIGPFVGQNLGAGKLQRLQKGVMMSQRFGLLWGVAMLLLLGLSGRWIAPLFTDNTQVMEYIVLYLMIVPFGYMARCVYALGNTILNVLDKPLLASSITLVQMFAIYLPMAYLGSMWLGLPGIFGALATAYTAGGAASYLLVRRELRQRIQKQKTPPASLEAVPA
ncbi:MAG: MATE family efflux transporter [Bacteroidetes bacterium]|nr:MAG: MATE family efflux transporter [Bacteroidota bacterium]